MALIEVFHLVASELPIDATASTDIPQGSVVVLGSDGFITTHTATAGWDDSYWPIGLAGDSRSTGTTSYTPESGAALATHQDTDGDGSAEDVFDKSNWTGTQAKGALITGAWGEAQRYTQNRVADNYNEVLASGKMTVYHSGGEFWTDQFLLADSGVQSYYMGRPVYMSDGTAGKITAKFPDDDTAAHLAQSAKNKVGICLKSNASYEGVSYPSGVPGVDTPFTQLNEGGNSMTYGQFLLIKLTV